MILPSKWDKLRQTPNHARKRNASYTKQSHRFVLSFVTPSLRIHLHAREWKSFVLRAEFLNMKYDSNLNVRTIIQKNVLVL